MVIDSSPSRNDETDKSKTKRKIRNNFKGKYLFSGIKSAAGESIRVCLSGAKLDWRNAATP